VRLGSGDGRVDVGLRLTLAGLEIGLAAMRGFDRVGSGLDLGLLREITPARVAIFRTLAVFELFDGGLGVVLSADDLNHPAGLIRPNVMADNGVGKCRFVARRQRAPICGRSPSRGKLKWPVEVPALLIIRLRCDIAGDLQGSACRVSAS
jgi:hypothetical protein